MPKPRSLHERETVDLHAPWWSPTKTTDGRATSPEWQKEADGVTYAPGGRYVERVVVYAQMLRADAQWVQARLLSHIKVSTAAVNNARRGAESEIDLGGTERSGLLTLQRMVVEMTDEHGASQPLTEATFAGLPEEDARFLESEIERLNAPLIVPGPQEERQARIAAETGRGETNHQTLASDNFRESGQAALFGGADPAD